MNNLAFSYNHSDAEANLILEALDALKKKVSIDGRLVELKAAPSAKYQADAAIELAYENGSFHYAVACKFAVDRKAHIDKIRRQLEAVGGPGLLVVPHLTKELAEHCRVTGLQF